jgi:ATP-dependent Clp protease ATP-binding subunit ClpB
VLLFDEVEKAHPDVFNTLLQLLDDGRLTDGQGRTVDFKNTVVILTSNLGTAELAVLEERRDLDADEKERLSAKVVEEALREHFRPEFLNRLDEVVLFKRLGREQIRSIVDIQLASLRERLGRRELGLDVSEAAKELLGELGWDPQYGARPLKRAIQKHLEDALARRLLAGEFAPGETIFVGRSGSELSFTRSSGDGAERDASQASSLN